MNVNDLTRLLRPLAIRIANLVGRGVVKSADASQDLQTLQIEFLQGEVRDDIEHFEGYGLTAKPLAGAEVGVVFVGGRRDHGLAFGAVDRRYRIKSLESGEVAVYNHTGAKIVMKANGDIEATPGTGGKFKVMGDVEASGDVTAGAGGVTPVSLQGHAHSVEGGNSAGSVVFIPTGKTGGPS